MPDKLSGAGAIGLVLVAGSVLPLQNQMLSAMVGRGLGPVTALALNSAVGIALLLAVNLMLHGPSAASNVAQAWRWWFVLPGLLGTFVVFALLTGYTRSGAAAPTVALIVGQVLMATLLDLAGFSARVDRMSTGGWVGLALFIGGAVIYLLADRR